MRSYYFAHACITFNINYHDEMSEFPSCNAGPSPSQLIEDLMHNAEFFTSDYDRYKYWLDHIAPVRGTFTIQRTPPGFAPERVRQQWEGVVLPMRCRLDIDDGVDILAREALEALKEKSQLAYAWWQKYYENMAILKIPKIDPEGFPEFLSNIDFLTFNPNCGDIEIY